MLAEDTYENINQAAEAGAKAADGCFTHRSLSHVESRRIWTCPYSNHCGLTWQPVQVGTENDPIASPFVRSTAGQIGHFSASMAADIGLAYLFHGTRHHKLGRWALAIGAGVSRIRCESAKSYTTR